MAGRLLRVLGAALAVCAGALILLADDPADPPARAIAAAEQCVPQPGDQMLDAGTLLHVPPDGRAARALVLAFHGAGGTGPGMAGYSGLSVTADEQGFAVLYPSAARNHFWSLNRKMGTEDLDHLEAVLPRALAAACVDAARVF